jgi:S-adenosylmethionine synthetase
LETLRFENNLHPQSAHIAQGVDLRIKDEGAGDQASCSALRPTKRLVVVETTLYSTAGSQWR